jgi:serine O-acetyltransferase
VNAIDLYRAGRWCHLRGWKLGARAVEKLIFLIFNSYVPSAAEIGPRTQLAYGGIGVVIHARSRIGADVLISQQVTIGGRSRFYDVPVIGDRCFLGPGSRILGPIELGEGSIVGANAVVIHDVPAFAVVAGVPARILRQGVKIEEYGDIAPWARAEAPRAEPAAAARIAAVPAAPKLPS